MSNLLKVLKFMRANFDNMAPEDFTYNEADKVRVAMGKYGIMMYHGATRVTFIDPTNHKFVYKISYADNPDFDESKRHPFYDLCAIENRFYEDAKKHGVDKLLLPNELVLTLHKGIKVYKQERYSYNMADVIDLWESVNRDLRDSLRNGHKTVKSSQIDDIVYSSFCRDTDDRWIKAAIDTYGMKIMKAYAQWTKDHKINDIHSGNTGFIGRRPIIIDYAGYHKKYED